MFDPSETVIQTAALVLAALLIGLVGIGGPLLVGYVFYRLAAVSMNQPWPTTIALLAYMFANYELLRWLMKRRVKR